MIYRDNFNNFTTSRAQNERRIRALFAKYYWWYTNNLKMEIRISVVIALNSQYCNNPTSLYFSIRRWEQDVIQLLE